MLQLLPAYRRLLHQHGVSQQVQCGFHICQYCLQRSHVITTSNGCQSCLHILRPVNLCGENYQLGLKERRRKQKLWLTFNEGFPNTILPFTLV